MLRRMLSLTCFLSLCLGALLVYRGETREPSSSSGLFFEQQVRPILEAKCSRCHGDEIQKSGLNLLQPAGIRSGGEAGPVIDRNEPKKSLLLERIHQREMPPKGSPALAEKEIKLIEQWIDAGAAMPGDPGGTSSVSEYQVVPVLLRRCTMCHGKERQDGALNLHGRQAMLAGGQSGPALVPGNPDASRLVQWVETKRCPPDDYISQAGIEPMTTDELELVKRWIAGGASAGVAEKPRSLLRSDRLVSDEDREFWSFQVPRRPPVPSIQDAQLARNGVDRFLLEKLQQEGLAFAGEADRLTLLRRVTFDLLGLPPTPGQVSAFLEDESPLAFEQLVDRLLASPEYGQRWSRFWLDLAGYADSEGKRNVDTERPFAYRWRDYVIRSFNGDKPYDEFLVEQLAGDELADYANPDVLNAQVVDQVVATGFLRMAPDGTLANPVNRVVDRVEVIADELDVLGRGVMGLTVNCARCHSHKYDPLPQRDYYRLMAIFKGAYDEYEWLVPQGHNSQKSDIAKFRQLSLVLPEEREGVERYNAPLRARIDSLQEQKKALDNKREKNEIKALNKQVTELESQLRPIPQVRALWDRGYPSPTFIYGRGDENLPGQRVAPGVPSMLLKAAGDLQIVAPKHSTPKTGRRLAFARWLTQENHPLTARVFVNRVWKQHFGQGLVATADDFGALGTSPSHPELLDWLAVEFMEQGWSIKHLHRMLVTSQAYRQSSRVESYHLQYDPDNQLVSRMPMRRLDAEQVRDAMLMVADRLSVRPYGVPDAVVVRKDGLATVQPSRHGWRRSVFAKQKRKELPTLLETFDLPQMNPNCTRRIESTVVSQPLFLLNNRLVHDWSLGFAMRVQSAVGNNVSDQVGHACLLAWGRPPRDTEQQAAEAALRSMVEKWRAETRETEQAISDQEGEVTHPFSVASRRERRNQASPEVLGLADFCHALFNTGKFLYVD